jgi:ubiquinone/menaquinone biosynthesis C-methylase UbiE
MAKNLKEGFTMFGISQKAKEKHPFFSNSPKNNNLITPGDNTTDNNFNEVGEYYSGEVGKFLEIIHEKHIHIGYWDEENMNAPLSEAARRLTNMMIEKVPINHNEYFIDIGCGCGLPGIELAKSKKYRVYGITASNYQKIEAEKAAKKEKISKLAKFFVCDATNTPFKDEQFAAGWFFESLIHMDPEKALLEARRILKPNGCLLIADFIAYPSLKGEDRKKAFETFHIKSAKSTLDEFQCFLEQNGFNVTEISDVTNYTSKFLTTKYLEGLERYKDEVVKTGGIEYYERMKLFWSSAREIIEDHVGYVLIKCRKK